MLDTESNESTDEASGFVCESEESFEAEPQAEVGEEQASSEPGEDAGEPSEEAKPEAQEEQEGGAKSEESDADSKESNQEPVSKKSRSAQKRIDKAIRQREDARRESEAVKQENERLKKQLDEKNKPSSDKEPVESDFDNYDQYLDALSAYDSGDKGEEEKPTDKKGEDKSAEQGGLTDSQAASVSVLQERIEAEDVPDDFKEVAYSDDVAITGDMVEALADCDNPVKVMYHLGKNKDLAAEISGKTPVQQAREIAKLDLTIDSKPAKPVKLTNAPDAISPVKGSDQQKKTHSEMSFAEFEADDRARSAGKKSTW